MKTILADAGPLYALAIPSDQYHQRAKAEERRLGKERIVVAVSYPTVFETHSLLLRRVTPEMAFRWRRQLGHNAGFITPKASDFERATQVVEAYADQTLSFFDGLMAVLSNRLEMPIWTFDSDFDVMRAEVWR